MSKLEISRGEKPENLLSRIDYLKFKYTAILAQDPYLSLEVNVPTVTSQISLISEQFVALRKNLNNKKFIDEFLPNLENMFTVFYNQFSEYPIATAGTLETESQFEEWKEELEILLFDAKLRIILNSDERLSKIDFTDIFQKEITHYVDILPGHLIQIFQGASDEKVEMKVLQVLSALDLFVRNFSLEQNPTSGKRLVFERELAVLKWNLKRLFYNVRKGGELVLKKGVDEIKVGEFFASLETLAKNLLATNELENKSVH